MQAVPCTVLGVAFLQILDVLGGLRVCESGKLNFRCIVVRRRRHQLSTLIVVIAAIVRLRRRSSLRPVLVLRH